MLSIAEITNSSQDGALQASSHARAVTPFTAGMTNGDRNGLLLARLFRGDAHAVDDTFEMLYGWLHQDIYNYLYRMTGNRPESGEVAADLTQDAFLKAYLALPRVSAPWNFGAWVYRIASNIFLDYVRHHALVKWQPWDTFLSVFHPTQVAKDDPERDVLAHEDTAEIAAILEKMHPKHRMCLVLREFHDLSYDEIAEVLNTTRAAVKSLLYRAREEFRQVYGKVERKPGSERLQRVAEATLTGERARERVRWIGPVWARQ